MRHRQQLWSRGFGEGVNTDGSGGRSLMQEEAPAPPAGNSGLGEFIPVGELMTVHLVAVGLRRDREAFAGLFRFFAPRLKSYFLRLGS
jgi:hypothetical protein